MLYYSSAAVDKDKKYHVADDEKNPKTSYVFGSYLMD